MKMRKLQCYRCDEIFNEEDSDVRSKSVGEFWGAPAMMDYKACPKCGSTELVEYIEPEEGEEE